MKSQRVRELMLREVKPLARGHTGLGVELGPAGVASKPIVLTALSSLGLSFPLCTGWGRDAQGLGGLSEGLVQPGQVSESSGWSRGRAPVGGDRPEEQAAACAL